MNVTIMNEPLNLNMHGFSGTAINRDYAGTAFKLMDTMWQVVKANDLKNTGLNIWVYESADKVFAGVELNEIPDAAKGLERKDMILSNYAYYKHVGPYHLIKQTTQRMKDELRSNGYETVLPYIEIYGHWTNDESKLETEILMCLK